MYWQTSNAPKRITFYGGYNLFLRIQSLSNANIVPSKLNSTYAIKDKNNSLC